MSRELMKHPLPNATLQEGVHCLGGLLSAMWKRSSLLSQGLPALVGMCCLGLWRQHKGTKICCQGSTQSVQGRASGGEGRARIAQQVLYTCFSPFKFQESFLQVVMSHKTRTVFSLFLISLGLRIFR